MGRKCQQGDVIQPVGNFSGVAYAAKEMGCEWMGQKELAQAIPPAYTRWIAEQFLQTNAEVRDRSGSGTPPQNQPS